MNRERFDGVMALTDRIVRFGRVSRGGRQIKKKKTVTPTLQSLTVLDPKFLRAHAPSAVYVDACSRGRIIQLHCNDELNYKCVDLDGEVLWRTYRTRHQQVLQTKTECQQSYPSRFESGTKCRRSRAGTVVSYLTQTIVVSFSGERRRSR